ncbi:MAG: aspartate aminotransferase [Desulfuromonas sp.]|nr:MAG: aspartate aminotransferase [Desulfuromonas sp.]
MIIADKIKDSIDRASWIRKMFEEGARLCKQYGAENIYDFTLGNPTVEPPARFYQELQNLANHPDPGMHRYMNNAGYAETRRAVAGKISRTAPTPLEEDHVIMTCGAGGALNVTLKTVLNPGDEVIILAPFFVEYCFYIENHGGTPVQVWTNRETFQLDIAAIEAAITPQTRAIIINSPNNPTGVIYPESSLQQLGELLTKTRDKSGQRILVISDEPYARISYDGVTVPNIFNSIDDAVIVTSHSKDLALPGERIGYLAANPVMADVDLFIDGATFANRTLGFVNAPALSQRLVANLQDESVDIDAYQLKRDLLYEELSGLGFKMVKPSGAFYLFPRSPLEDDVEFVKRAQHHHLLLVPGSGFGAPGFFRIAYCIDLSIIERSLPAWRNLARDLGM